MEDGDKFAKTCSLLRAHCVACCTAQWFLPSVQAGYGCFYDSGRDPIVLLLSPLLSRMNGTEVPGRLSDGQNVPLSYEGILDQSSATGSKARFGL